MCAIQATEPDFFEDCVPCYLMMPLNNVLDCLAGSMTSLQSFLRVDSNYTFGARTRSFHGLHN